MIFFEHPPLIVLAAVFLLIAVRQVGRFRFQIWQIMSLGAAAVLVLGSISIADAAKSINLDVILFLFGMFVVGEGLNRSGYLYQLSHRFFSRAMSVRHLILSILVGMGLLSALLMNDTMAIICTPLVIYYARQHNLPPRLLLLALAFAVTTGAVMSPIGNPQNLLVAVAGGFSNPFLEFIGSLAVPTMINLGICYFALRWYFRKDFHSESLRHVNNMPQDRHLMWLSRAALWLVVGLIGIRIIVPYISPALQFGLPWIALLAAAPILLLSRHRWQILRDIDWTTLVFFAAMFILMESVWQTGIFQQLVGPKGLAGGQPGAILGVSLLVSQLISNVPYVALVAPHLPHSTAAFMALAAGSSISGNMLILGAASNVIIIQNAEKHGETITFWEFARIGVPMTIVQALVYWGWLSLVDLYVKSAL